MIRRIFLHRLAAGAALACLLAPPALAQTPENQPSSAPGAVAPAVLERSLRGMAQQRAAYAALASATGALTAPAEACDAEALRTAYHGTFDAWMGVQHVNFGPVEKDGRRFAIEFWPDAKGFTAKALNRLIAAEDPATLEPETFAKASVAARGLLALERMLYDDKGPIAALEGYRCRLTAAIARDLAATAAAIAAEWPKTDEEKGAAADPQERLRELYMSFDTGLEGLSALRIGRPLGSLTRPRPRRAEAWRSGRSTRNIRLSLAAMAALYRDVFADALAPEERERFEAALARTEVVAGRAPDDLPGALADPQTRIKLEALQTRIRNLQGLAREILAPALGAQIGFNSLDGD